MTCRHGLLEVIPCGLDEANTFVALWHRHHQPVVGHKFSLAVCDKENIRGVAIVGRPVSRRLDDGMTLEVTRVATDGAKNACSMLYGAGFARTGSDNPRRTEYSATSYNIPSDTGIMHRFGDTGGASRFFYVAKPSRAERDQGVEHLTPKQRDDSRKEGNPGGDNPRNRGLQRRGNHHPTVKPVELMRYLVRLVTPTGGTVIDPFTGSGTTGMACAFEGFQFIGIEREPEYVEIAERRIASVCPLFNAEQPA